MYAQKQVKQNTREFEFYTENCQEPGRIVSEESHDWVFILDFYLGWIGAGQS